MSSRLGVAVKGDGVRFDRRALLMLVLFSAALSVGILGLRNLFDDEVFSLPFVTGPVSGIVQMAREGDVHPPGMYLLAHVAWRLIPSYRWLSLVELAILYAGLSAFLLNFMPRLHTRSAVLISLIFGTLHPELLMWSNTLRWYCPWTGLALVALVLCLRPRRAEWRLGCGKGLTAALVLAAMFYLNYITLLFVLALGIAIFDRRRRGYRSGSLRGLVLAGGVFLALILPQVHTMVAVHLPNSHAQRRGIFLSAVRLIQALASSEAYVPWHPLAMAAGVVSAILIARGVAAVFRGRNGEGHSSGSEVARTADRSLAVFSVSFMLLVVVAGLGGMPRNAILLVPALAPTLGIGAASLRERYQWLVVVLLGAWAAFGAAHLMGRFGLQKSSMNDRPEQVISLITAEESKRSPDSRCGVAVTYDGGAAFTLAQARIPGLMILSPYRGAAFAGTVTELPEDCSRPVLYLIDSYASGEPNRDWKYTTEVNAAKQFVGGAHFEARLSPDHDAAMKRRLSRLAGLSAGTSLPDYRFIVFWGEMDPAQFSALRRTLHYFVSGEDVVPDWPAGYKPPERRGSE